jgi:tetratricopeptide (TPR) repeat protein
MGMVAILRRDDARAKTLLNRGLKFACKFRNTNIERISILYEQLGALAISREEYPSAEAYLQRSLELASKMEYKWLISSIRNMQGELLLRQRKISQASVAFDNALEIAKEIYSQDQMASSLYGRGRVAFAQDNIDKARCYGGQSLNIFQRLRHIKAAEVSQWLDEH